MAALEKEKNLLRFEILKPRNEDEWKLFWIVFIGKTTYNTDGRHVTNGGDQWQCPVPRSGHRIVVTNKVLYAVGGFNPRYWTVENDDYTIYPLFKELWRFNLTTREWWQEYTTGAMPVELASHAAVMEGNHLLVHGGTGTPFGQASSNQLHACNLAKLEWNEVHCRGDLPQRLYGHSLTVTKEHIYMFGGTTGYEYSNDLHRLDLDTFTWHKYDVEGQMVPEGRYRHEAVHDPDRNYFYIFGGGTAHTSFLFDQLAAFDLENQKWQKVSTQAFDRQGFPEARRCHSCVKFKKGVYICGGYDGEKVFSDFWRFDLTTFYWCQITNMEKPVYFHSADVTPEGCMYIFGGVNTIDTVRNSDIYRIWLQPPSLGELSWMKIVDLMKDVITSIPLTTLAEMGIPRSFLERLGRTS